MTEAPVREQLAQGRYLTVLRLGVDPGTFWPPVRLITVCLLYTSDAADE